MACNGSSETGASARLHAQIPIEDQVEYAGVVIDDWSSCKELKAQVNALVWRLERRAGWPWAVSWLVPPLDCEPLPFQMQWPHFSQRYRKVKVREYNLPRKFVKYPNLQWSCYSKTVCTFISILCIYGLKDPDTRELESCLKAIVFRPTCGYRLLVLTQAHNSWPWMWQNVLPNHLDLEWALLWDSGMRRCGG